MLAVHKPGAPFIEAPFTGIDPTFMDCRLAVRTAAGWFVASKSLVFAYSSLEEPIDPKSGGSKKSFSSAGSAAIDGNQLVVADEDPPPNGKKNPPRRIPLVFP